MSVSAPDRLTGPVTGTDRLPEDPMAAIALNRVPRVPVLIGTNTDEFTLFAAVQYLKNHGLPSYSTLISETFGADAAAVAAHYPLQRYGGSTGLAYSAAVTDGEFACPADRMATGLARSAPVYAYEFNDRTAPAPDVFHQAPFPVGAGHGLELRYLFDIGGAPAAESRAASAVRPDDRLLEPVREDRNAGRRRCAAVAAVLLRRARPGRGCRCRLRSRPSPPTTPRATNARSGRRWHGPR